ncbi:hypothetical protein [Limnohabitans sp.]
MDKFADKVPLMVCAAVLVMKSVLLVPVSAENASVEMVVVGAVVSISIALLAPKELAAPGVANVTVALLPAASLMVPLFKANADVEM